MAQIGDHNTMHFKFKSFLSRHIELKFMREPERHPLTAFRFVVNPWETEFQGVVLDVLMPELKELGFAVHPEIKIETDAVALYVVMMVFLYCENEDDVAVARLKGIEKQYDFLPR